MARTKITIKAARDIGKAHDCLGVVVVGILRSQFQVITRGRTQFICESLKGVGEAVAAMIETGDIQIDTPPYDDLGPGRIHHETEVDT